MHVSQVDNYYRIIFKRVREKNDESVNGPPRGLFIPRTTRRFSPSLVRDRLECRRSHYYSHVPLGSAGKRDTVGVLCGTTRGNETTIIIINLKLLSLLLLFSERRPDGRRAHVFPIRS